MHSIRYHGRSLAAHRFCSARLGRPHARRRFKLFLNAARLVAIACLVCSAVGSRIEIALGDIYYDSASPNAGQVIPGTQGITPGPGVDLSGWNSPGHELEFALLDYPDLTNASFENSDLFEAGFYGANLTNANFTGANLANASFDSSTLTNAGFSGAIVTGASFRGMSSPVPTAVLTAGQLYSTASYASGNLAGIVLASNDLTGWDFANQNLTNANFNGSTLTNANFQGAIIKGADFSDEFFPGSLTASQLYSTASYSGGDLTGILLGDRDLTGWNFANQNLTNAKFFYSTLTNANFTAQLSRGPISFSRRGTLLPPPNSTAPPATPAAT